MLKEKPGLFIVTAVLSHPFPYHDSLLRKETTVRLTATLSNGHSTRIIDFENKHSSCTFFFSF